ncbi:MAG TPA: AAA family ATPase [Kofleriaceae bacterium]|nr:AAA family ATPase [Kofleriaceae bacterium]
MAPVLQQLTLGAYRGISQLQLHELSAVSLVVGANNAGKTSILEAAGLVLRPADPGQWVSTLRRRDADMDLVDGIWSMFPGSEALHLDDGGQESSALTLEAILGGTQRQLHGTAVATQVTGSDGGSGLTLRMEMNVDGHLVGLSFAPPKAALFPGTIIKTYRTFTVTPASHYSTDIFVEQLSQVVDAGRKQLAVQMLRIFDPAVVDLDVVASLGRKAVRVTHKIRGVVDLSSFGDGMRRAAVLALALTRASGGVVLVDEIEAGIHHSLLRPSLARLLEAASESKVQILATTHSLEAIDAVIGAVEDRGTPDALAAYWVQRGPTGHEVRRYDFDKLCTLRDGGLDIR